MKVTERNLFKISHGFVRQNVFFTLAFAAFGIVATCMAFRNALSVTPDEAYHFAIIKLYAQQYSPLIHHQTAASIATANDVVRFPSYLYHYVLSFPYRLFARFGLHGRSLLVSLRLLNVCFGLGTILLLRKLLGQVTSKHIANFSAGLFALLPITMVTFAGLNYDNLLLPAIFASIFLLLSITRAPSVLKIGWLLALMAFGCLIEYTFLPIAVVEFCYLAWIVARRARELRTDLRAEMSHMRPMIFVCVAALLLGLGLFGERYGVNIVRYRTITPACQVVHPLEQCLAFPINARNYAAAHSGVLPAHNVAVYAISDWYRNMVRGLIYPSPWLFLRYVIAFVLFASVVAVAICRKLGLVPREFGWFLLVLCGFYTLCVFGDDYHQYRLLGQPYAINGRYLLPVLPFVVAIAVRNIATFAPKRLRTFAQKKSS